MHDTPKKALVYCRVSTTKQVIEGGGLDSQELRCRQYAERNGYVVENVFPDDASGGGDYMNRPGMVSLLNYLDVNSKTNYVVIFDDLKRFARDTVFHWQLRSQLAQYGATVECLNFKFEDTPEGQFMETMMAANGQLERQQGRRQTKQKMKAQLEMGYWQFPVPKGYQFIGTKSDSGKILLKEPVASIVREALVGFSQGRFQTKAEVQRFLQECPEYPRGASGRVSAQTVHDMLTYVFYAGYLEYPAWGVSRRLAKHEALISFETYLKNQEILQGRAKAPKRADINADFLLRGFVDCRCSKPLTAYWAKGRNKRYPYYQCQNKQCEFFGKAIKRDVIETEFGEILKSMTPTTKVISIVERMFKSLWKHRSLQQGERVKTLQAQERKIDTEIARLLDRIVETTSDSVIKNYERKIEKLEDEKIVLQEKMAKTGSPLRGLSESYRTGLEFLENPYKIWVKGPLENQHAVLKMAFSDRLTYVPNDGYRTAKTTLPFKVLRGFSESINEMVGRDGFEPSTNWLKANCSTN